MYKFSYFDNRINKMLCDKEVFWDPELERELVPILKELRRAGEIAGANCGKNLAAPGQLYFTIEGRNFKIGYTVNVLAKEVRFYEFQQVSHSFNWEEALNQSVLCGQNEPIYIPQIGDPHKYIQAIELIGFGIGDSKEIGIRFGSGAKRDKDLARRGDYLGRPLLELGLAKKKRVEDSLKSIYVLTEKGDRIAQADRIETQERLLAEALLGFYPIQVIIDEATCGKQDLSLDLIQDTITLTSLGDCGGTTLRRRAGSLRALVNWVTRWAGIPMCRKGDDGIQLYIPYIYANTNL